MDLSVMVDGVKFNYRAGLLIRRGDKILVECNPEVDFVTIPGGRIKTLESSKEGLIRELSEEMKIAIKEDEIRIKALIENFFNFDDKNYHELYILYKLNVKEDDDRFSDDMINYDSKASYYKWVDRNRLKEANLLPVCVRNLKDDNSFEHLIVNDLR